jgi:4-hydroxy-tetrahydrodipicolinate reductase
MPDGDGPILRVAVAGAAGRMGATVCEAVGGAGDMELVARADPALGVTLTEALADARPDVLVDFTIPSTAVANAHEAVAAGVHVVIGTTGFAPGALDDLRGAGANVFVAPNFAIGAVLMMQFAATAARHMRAAEIIELHHDGKFDRPSGTAARTAALMRAAAGDAQGGHAGGEGGVRGDAGAGGERGEGEDGGAGGERGAGGESGAGGERGAGGESAREIPIHSVRLPGLVAHQEVILGDVGQTLTIRHDSIDRVSFMPGVLLAVRRVGSLSESPLFGLEHLL